jgi:hypothetical protein
VAGDNFQVVDRSFFADFSFENKDALNTGLLRERRINRLLTCEEQICGSERFHLPYALRRRWRWRWGGGGAGRSISFTLVQHTSKNAGQHT